MYACPCLHCIGPYDQDGNKCFLSVMPFRNQSKAYHLYCISNACMYTFTSVEDLYKQFTEKKNLTCVLDYMMEYQDQQKYIFRNYTVLFQHVFEGLCYLKHKGIVHRDVKCM